MPRTYKVVEIKKASFFKGRLTAQQLEQKINEMAAQGWVFDKALGGETLLLGADTFLLVFYWEPPPQQHPPHHHPPQGFVPPHGQPPPYR